MPLAANSPADRVEQLIDLTDRLAKMVAEETALLHNREPRELQSLIDEKARLASLYGHEMARVSADKSLVSAAPAEAKARLKSATEQFRKLLEEHGRSIARARRLSEGLIKSIGSEVKAARETVTGYGRNAAVSAYGGRLGASLAVNQTV